MTAKKRWCYWVPAAQDTRIHGGLVPSVVTEGEAGHKPVDWVVWAGPYERARKKCALVNKMMGISPKAADEIVASSLLATCDR